MEVDKNMAVSVVMQKPNYMLMSLQRIVVLLVILASVVVVVYYTPMPEEYFENCDQSWGHTDGHRFTYPASPLLTQGAGIPPESICSSNTGQGEECVHVKNIRLDSTVEIIMFDQGGESDHIFHLHGYSFYVVAIQKFNKTLEKDMVIKMNNDGTLFPSRNIIRPVLKDTIVIPKFGIVSLRFQADNPGYWLMRDERSAHWTRGLDFVFKVGTEKDFVQAPSDFPKCGSYVGPEYFLI
ncbi:unnamed protein product [Leptidea sinapis]|uniref:Plastocyanin-like domain-containing protein n=1 Tax=Leptidea sinapis TaxID=189913 RepID=A0A5E4QHC8_9NEOP|nr:unnamed protein product [Leptidea sinapis]